MTMSAKATKLDAIGSLRGATGPRGALDPTRRRHAAAVVKRVGPGTHHVPDLVRCLRGTCMAPAVTVI